MKEHVRKKKFLELLSSPAVSNKLSTNQLSAKISVLAHNSESATFADVQPHHKNLSSTTKFRQLQQPQSWVVFTAKERVSVLRPSHTRDQCPPGSRAPQRQLSRTSADSPGKVLLLRKSVLSSETAMVSLKSRSSLVRNLRDEISIKILKLTRPCAQVTKF
jgi:hypothetical protein